MDYQIEYYSFSELEKQASGGARAACQQIMDRIREENPEYWPYGLGVDMCDGGAYIVRKQASKEAVGFVGWQERPRGFKKVGFYCIGILPEHRHKGFAKKAVQEIIRRCASGVDEVRALIEHTNEPSLSLADSLGVKVETI